MQSVPESLTLLLRQLKGMFDIDASTVQKDETIFQIDIHDAPLVVLFYTSLLRHIKHEETPQTHKRVIHIDEDLFLFRKEVVVTRIGAAVGKAKKIYARETLLLRINKEESLKFQEHHHLQVPLPGKYRFGLFHQGELLSVAIFSGGRKMYQQSDDYRSFELLRFCHKSGHLVIGGLSKLMRGMIRHFNPGDIMTYVDRDWSDGKNYEKLGFENLGITPPQKFYVDHLTGLRYHEKAYHLLAKPSEKAGRNKYTSALNLGSIKMRYTV